MKEIIENLKNRIENNLNEVEFYYEPIQIFLSQINILNEVTLKNFNIKQWIYENRYTIKIIEEILEKIENDKRIIA